NIDSFERIFKAHLDNSKVIEFDSRSNNKADKDNKKSAKVDQVDKIIELDCRNKIEVEKEALKNC
ncbi:1124_t:CDS:1, partial [Dentiscutata heterogama]